MALTPPDAGGDTALIRPDERFHASWADAVREFGDGVMHGSGLWDVDLGDLSAQTFAGHVAHLRSQADPAHVPDDKVPCTYFWIVDPALGDDGFVGYLALRHSLTAWLLEEGGHIGYSVRPARRREGHVRRALDLGLVEAAGLGLGEVLVTCDEDNVGSRLTIEGAVANHGGRYEDTRAGKRRYWVTTPPSRRGPGATGRA